MLQMVAAAMKLRHLLLGRKAMTNLKSGSESTSVLSNSYSPWNPLGQNTGLGSLSILQGIFPTQGSSQPRSPANLDSILKNRDITLPTKIHIIKAMVLQVVMYGYENWSIKKAECQRIDAFELWFWIRILRVLLGDQTSQS